MLMAGNSPLSAVYGASVVALPCIEHGRSAGRLRAGERRCGEADSSRTTAQSTDSRTAASLAVWARLVSSETGLRPSAARCSRPSDVPSEAPRRPPQAFLGVGIDESQVSVSAASRAISLARKRSRQRVGERLSNPSASLPRAGDWPRRHQQHTRRLRPRPLRWAVAGSVTRRGQASRARSLGGGTPAFGWPDDPQAQRAGLDLARPVDPEQQRLDRDLGSDRSRVNELQRLWSSAGGGPSRPSRGSNPFRTTQARDASSGMGSNIGSRVRSEVTTSPPAAVTTRVSSRRRSTRASDRGRMRSSICDHGSRNSAIQGTARERGDASAARVRAERNRGREQDSRTRCRPQGAGSARDGEGNPQRERVGHVEVVAQQASSTVECGPHWLSDQHAGAGVPSVGRPRGAQNLPGSGARVLSVRTRGGRLPVSR